MVLPLLRLHDVRGERKALRRDSDAVPEAEDFSTTLEMTSYRNDKEKQM